MGHCSDRRATLMRRRAPRATAIAMAAVLITARPIAAALIAAALIAAALVAAALIAAAGASAPARAVERLAADLSRSVVTITTGFTGSTVLFFGATDGAGDVVITVSGPAAPQVVRRKERVNGIWINRVAVRFLSVPAFYAVAASAPLATLLTPAQAAEHQVGLDKLKLDTIEKLPPLEAQVFRAGLIRNMIREGLYQRAPARVNFPNLSERLFRTELFFPSNVPTGRYTVRFLLVRNKRIVSTFDKTLLVGKAGLSAQVFRIARSQPALYGLAAVILAALAGWIASVVFRRS